MKIVIDIPETVYREFTAGTQSMKNDAIIANAVFDGQPLPKGHGRLIDADEYSRKMREQQNRVAEYRDHLAKEAGCYTEQYYRADSSLLGYIDARLTLDKIQTIIEADKEAET